MNRSWEGPLRSRCGSGSSKSGCTPLRKRLAHNRLALDVPAKGAEFDILIETRDAQHTREVEKALTESGYPPRKLS